MNNSPQLTRKDKTIGDAAVDGLLGGVAAGILMAVYLVIGGLLSGVGPATVLGRLAASGNTSPLTGGLSHLAVSAVYGVLFGLGWQALGRRAGRALPVWLAGLIYGVGLLVVAVVIVLPRTASPLREIHLIHLAVAHSLYGLALGLLMARHSRRD